MDTTLPFDINDFKRDSPRHSYDGSSSSSMFFLEFLEEIFWMFFYFPYLSTTNTSDKQPFGREEHFKFQYGRLFQACK